MEMPMRLVWGAGR